MTKSTTEREPALAPKLTLLREKLGRKAKEEPKFRFYSLYGHLLRPDVLESAWKLVKKNGGSPGIDGTTFEEIEQSPEGISGFLEGIASSLQNKSYQADPVKRVYIPKPNGQQRPLGIPTIKDRVVQMALLLILEPIFEMDFHDCSYGFRPGRSAHQAIECIQTAVNQGYRTVYDADLKGYFDSIPHDKLMAALRMRVVDRHVLRLIRLWLKAPIVEPKGTTNKPKKGTPQGGVISPLLANVYLHWFDTVFHRRGGPAHWAGAKLVRYADDFVILVRYGTDRLWDFVEGKIENWLGLRINRDKTQIVDLNEEGSQLDFLGYSFRYVRTRNRSRKYCYLSPSPKSLQRARDRVRELTANRRTSLPVGEVVNRLNRFLQGWSQYFSLGYPSKSYGKLNYFVGERLIKHLMRRSQKGFKRGRRETWFHLFTGLGLYRLRKWKVRPNA